MDILLVDDDDDIRFLVARMLAKHGHRVRVAECGESAISDIERHGLPDLVILDQNMPRMTGMETLSKLRERWPELPVLISSGHDEIEGWDRIRSRRTALLPKPFGMDDLLERLQRVHDS